MLATRMKGPRRLKTWMWTQDTPRKLETKTRAAGKPEAVVSAKGGATGVYSHPFSYGEWGFPAEAVKMNSLSYSSLGCRVAIQLSPTASPSGFPEVRAGLADRPASLDPSLG